MNLENVRHTNKPSPTNTSTSKFLLQRKCACGQHTKGSAECPECRKKRPKLPLQTKLKIGGINDRYEQEADRVAEQVMRMPDPQINSSNEHNRHTQVAPLIQRKASNIQIGGTSEAPPIVHDVLRSSGHPLDQTTRGFMEPRFGHDFSRVRLHTDAKAAQSAREVGALAYTVGNNIVLSDHQSMYESTSRQRIIAHELTHTIQQTGGSSNDSHMSSPKHNPAEGNFNTNAHNKVSRGSLVCLKRITETLQRLGGNPGCTAGQARQIHQSIFDANSWVRKALTALAARPLVARTLRALRNNFGASGTAANAPTIATNLRAGQTDMTSIPFSCADATDATCATLPCGYTSAAGAHAAVICTNVTLATNNAVYRGGCALHEAMHASNASMTGDVYSGWFGNSGSTAGYPGASPLTNADSYTTLAMELS
jgi:hypothetical protein